MTRILSRDNYCHALCVITKRTQLTFTCSKSTIETLKKICEIYSKLTIKIPERRLQ